MSYISPLARFTNEGHWFICKSIIIRQNITNKCFSCGNVHTHTPKQHTYICVYIYVHVFLFSYYLKSRPRHLVTQPKASFHTDLSVFTPSRPHLGLNHRPDFYISFNSHFFPIIHSLFFQFFHSGNHLFAHTFIHILLHTFIHTLVVCICV